MKFKVGDIVIMNYEYNNSWEGNGKPTKIIRIENGNLRPYVVDFQSKIDKSNNHIPFYYFKEYELTLANSHIIKERLGIK